MALLKIEHMQKGEVTLLCACDMPYSIQNMTSGEKNLCARFSGELSPCDRFVCINELSAAAVGTTLIAESVP